MKAEDQRTINIKGRIFIIVKQYQKLWN
jgi:hypothetical protein